MHVHFIVVAKNQNQPDVATHACMNVYVLKRYYSYIEPCIVIFDQIILFS